MTSWAGIESGPGSSGTDPSELSVGVSSGSSRGVASARSRRRLRRQQRPIVGSIDDAGVLVQHKTREVVVGSVWILLPGVVLNLIATTLAFDRYQTFKGSTVSVPELLGGEKAATGIEELLWYIGLIVSSLSAALVGGYVATLTVRWRTGQSVSVRIGYRAMVRRLPAVVLAWLVGHCWFPIVALILSRVSSSSLAPLAVFGAPLVLIAATMTLVASPAIVIEGLGPIAGLRRAWRLARSRFGTLLGFVLLSILIGLLVQYGIAYLPRLLQTTGLVGFGRFGWLIEGVAGQLGRLISVPLVAVATALVYLDTRMSKEGLDLVLDAERVFGVTR